MIQEDLLDYLDNAESNSINVVYINTRSVNKNMSKFLLNRHF